MPSKDLQASSRKEPPIKTIQSLMSLKDHLPQLAEPMKSMESHLNNMSPSITVEEVMKLHQKKSQHQRNHQPKPLQDLLVFSRKEQPIKTIQPAKSLKDHWPQLHAPMTLKESHLSNM